MRTILILWLIPVVLFWGWYGLSAHDMNFGMFFLSRDFHDHIFQLYSKILQMPAEEIPVKLAWLFAIDTLIVFGIAALRWYKHWLPQTIEYVRSAFGFETSKVRLEKRVERVLQAHENAQKHHVNDALIGPVQPAK